MSTAGKVLAVLAVLLSLVWVLFAAAVTELNRNGNKAVEAVQAKVVKLQEDLKAAERSFVELRDQTYHEQTLAQEDLTILEGRQVALEKARAQVLETLSRVKYQVEGVSATGKQALVSRGQRAAEKEAETKAKADAEAEVEKLKAANAESRTRLTTLRDQFKAAREANKAMVQALLKKAKPPGPQADARAASIAR